MGIEPNRVLIALMNKHITMLSVTVGQEPLSYRVTFYAIMWNISIVINRIFATPVCTLSYIHTTLQI